jgi:5-methylcytosine-specific restriction endonuclease McrBC regulatory subunit McrC
MNINLVDNTTYTDNIQGLSILEKLPANPLTTKDLESVEFLKNTEDRESETFILKIETINGKKVLQTGNMIGEFYFKTYKTKDKIAVLHKISIGLRFDKDSSNDLLEYLLNYTNALYPNEIKFGNSNKKPKTRSNSIVELLLSNLFVYSISKANVMGLPKVYVEMEEKDYSVRGRINLQHLISQEIPFKGKTPYIRNVRVVVTSIGSVLLKTITIVLSKIKSFSTLIEIRNDLLLENITSHLSVKILHEALNHQVLKHPAFLEYKNTLYLASLILKGFKKPEPDQVEGLFYGYLVDTSKLWENFIVRLLEQHISDEWKIMQEPKLKLFKNRPDNIFGLSNYMLPDIVMINEDKKQIMIFDAKFKNSKWFNREDFYKTTTYISYYQNHNNNYKVITSGQIYPDKNLNDINQNLGFLDSDTDFRLFGIDIVNEVINKNSKIQFIDIIKEIIIKQT